ncbi:MAG: hypothetical protein H7840_00250 [Alphaproteobacteria bacterium]
MTASPADRRWRHRIATAVLAVPVLAVLAIAPAAGQERKPVPLVQPWDRETEFDRQPAQPAQPTVATDPAVAVPGSPPGGARPLLPAAGESATPAEGAPRQPLPAQTTAPATTAPATTAPGQPAPSRPAAGRPTRPVPLGRIQSEPLAAVDPDSLGLAEPPHGGLGPAMWQGGSRDLIRRGLSIMPVDTPSHTVHALARRLLTTVAAPPPPSPGGSTLPLLPLRLERLVALGRTDDVATIIGMVAPVNVTESVLRSRVDSLLIDGDTNAACRDVGSAIKAFPDVFWQKAFILCQILAGNRESAATSFDVLRERGHEEPVFVHGIETLLGLHKWSLKSLPDPSPLTIAIVRAAKAPFPKDLLKTASPAVLRAMAQSTGTDADMRLAAAERAEGMGALDTAILRDVYRAIEFGEAERATPPADIAVDKTPRLRALLYQIILMQSDSGARAGLISRVLDLSRGAAFLTAARVYQPMIEAMQPGPDLAWFSGRAARALMAAGRNDLAASWFGLAQQFAASSDEAAQAARTLWPLARLSHPTQGEPWSAEAFGAWRTAQGDIPAERLTARSILLLNALDAVGEPLSGNEWAEVMESPGLHQAQLPGLPVWHALTQAAAGRRVGETVLLSIIALGGKDPGAVDPATLHHVVAALRLVGLDTEARALAVEAAVTGGL